MMDREKRSLEETPTWAVSILCFALFLISLIIDAALRHLTQFLKRRSSKSLNKGLRKIKTEMMIMGFISLLLTILEDPVSKICVTKAVANSFLPCKDPQESIEPTVSSAAQISGLNSNKNLSGITNEPYCEEKGMVSLMSSKGILQLNIFISVLAVFHVLYSILIMCLGKAKMRRWKSWEEETRTLEYQIANDPRRFQLTRQTTFGQRHLKFWSDYPLLLWPACFIRQFSGSVSKADYLTLRNGFIMAHFAEGSNFNFQKFLGRAFDEDFEQVIEIRFWIWIFSILFIFFSAHEFYNYYWLPFIPLAIVVVVGTKLEVVITKMCSESYKRNAVIQGTFPVKPNDDFFWFGRPKWLLHLIQFVLIQNSFQLAFFTWTWYEYGLRSCFNGEDVEIALRIATDVVVQFLCGYVTLPLYALVTQVYQRGYSYRYMKMGSRMKKAVFSDLIVKGLKNWHKLAKRNISKNRSSVIRYSTDSWPIDSTESSSTDMKRLYHPKVDYLPSLELMISPSQEITEETMQHNHIPPAVTSLLNPEITGEKTPHKIITRGSYDGEISFASTWKELVSGKSSEDIILSSV